MNGFIQYCTPRTYDLALENFNLLDTENSLLIELEGLTFPSSQLSSDMLLDQVGNPSYPVYYKQAAADILMDRSTYQAFLWQNYFMNDPNKPEPPIRGMIANRIKEQPDIAQYFPVY